jgi:DMSO/TMAO reductase YedYZ heme-binding membrane subunit
MSERYAPVGWNASKIVYDAVVVAIVGLYISAFLWIAPSFQHVTQPLDDYTARMNAFGTCAFLLLSLILAIGPAARLDPRFLPLLYNRRHLGVIATAVASTHAYAALDWYFSYGPYDRFEMLLRGNTSFFQAHGFPFEVFGIFALLVMFLLAATSHDFWLRIFRWGRCRRPPIRCWPWSLGCARSASRYCMWPRRGCPPSKRLWLMAGSTPVRSPRSTKIMASS